MKTPKIRPARHSDAIEIPRSGKVWVMENDEEILGFGGILFGSFVEAFLDLKPAAFEYPVALARGAKAFRRVLGEQEEVYAFADERYPTAPRFLNWIGFRPVAIVDGRELYLWHTQRP